jgi:hypothetical protein
MRENKEAEAYLILQDLHGRTDEELKEYFLQLEAWRNEDDINDYCLEFNLVRTVARMRGVTLPDEKLYEEIKTPGSRGIAWVKYYFTGRFLEVQYKSGGKVYPFYEIPRSKFKEFKQVVESGGSAGHFVDSLKKKCENGIYKK